MGLDRRKSKGIRTAQQAAIFLGAGDLGGSAVWQLELKAIDEILREDRHEGEALN